MRSFLKSLPAALLTLLFVYASASKLLAFGDFRTQLYLQPFPHAVSDFLRFMLPVTEIIAVLLLLFNRTYFAGLQLALYLLLSFTGYIALVLLGFWPQVPCSCGGILRRMSWEVHLLFNLLFLFINLIAIHLHLKERRLTAA